MIIIFLGAQKRKLIRLNIRLEIKIYFFSPHIPYSKVNIEIKNMDVCILPYTSKITVAGNVGDISKFTSPLKLFDYMKLGKLIISSNLSVLREVLVDKENSLLVNRFNDEKEWYKKISLVSKNFKKSTTIRNNAFNYAKKFDLNWRVKKLLSF
ncbi:glycosyltransferase [Candidatus Pelagibacter sp. Uisw_121]|uniref:glycosyltransferase n=1 Tax=Candidatus Pelagibacter sp. Uisw_121 TaxID=3230987 RepID=UPI0039EA5CFC